MDKQVGVFMYHDVIDPQGKSGFLGKSAQPFKHSKQEFNGLLNIIQDLGTSPVLIDEVDFSSDEREILLTFDDGGASSLYIADELENRGWRGHFFISTEFVGKPHFLQPPEIRDLHARGHVIGTHSHSHAAPFYLLSEERMRDEWQRSIQILQDTVQDEITSGSVPGGEMDKRTQVSAHEAGLRYLFTSLPTLNCWQINGMIALGRVCPKSGTKMRKIKRLAEFKTYNYEMAMWSAKRLVRKAMVQALSIQPSAPKTA